MPVGLAEPETRAAGSSGRAAQAYCRLCLCMPSLLLLPSQRAAPPSQLPRPASASVQQTHACSLSRAANIDLDVLVYTNTTPDGEAAAGGTAAYAANIRSLFSGLTDPDRQRAVINIDGGCLWALRLSEVGREGRRANTSRLSA